jgi:uncharacterized membrane protein
MVPSAMNSNRDPSSQILFWILIGVTAIAVVVVLYWLTTVAGQARRRGYSFPVWLLACLVSFNPLLILIVLMLLPDRRRQRLRKKERATLEEKLARAVPIPTTVLGEYVPRQSLGDRSTAAPPANSLGDEETQPGPE